MKKLMLLGLGVHLKSSGNYATCGLHVGVELTLGPGDLQAPLASICDNVQHLSEDFPFTPSQALPFAPVYV